MKVLLIAPIAGNGGIRSWANRFEKAFPEKYPNVSVVRISGTDRRVTNPDVGKIRGALNGILDLVEVCKTVRRLFKSGEFDILHATTSGRNGSLRDFLLGRIARRYKVKSIMHCRYGCIPQVYPTNSFEGYMTRKAMDTMDNVWVLDSPAFKFLNTKPSLKEKIRLTPNSIRVGVLKEISPKHYKSVGFVGNVIVTKGVYELTQAVISTPETTLDFIGPIEDVVLTRIKEIAGVEYGSRVKVHGKLPNDEAVKIMERFDIVSLPTYFPGEAFPISILEAMSKGKLVISCPRAAIPDMLTATDGSRCGLLVSEKSASEISDAIRWAQMNTEDADAMCKKAYQKVHDCYREEVVYALYMQLYDELIKA